MYLSRRTSPLRRRPRTWAPCRALSSKVGGGGSTFLVSSFSFGFFSRPGQVDLTFASCSYYVDRYYSPLVATTVIFLVEVSKSEITSYINKHKKQYEVEATRDLQYVEFKEVATIEDENNKEMLLENNCWLMRHSEGMNCYFHKKKESTAISLI